MAYECPAGYACAAGTISPSKCGPGQYTEGKKASTCETCPAGSFCTELGRKTTCEPGHYCPGDDTKVKCPFGTLNRASGSSSEKACGACDAGRACTDAGLSSVTVPCGAGHICTGGTATTKPGCTGGTAGLSHNGRLCHPGEHCPQGVSTSTQCPAGYYCKDYGAATETQQCPAGHYCPKGTSLETIKVCSAGHYCVAGSATETPCPVGTYSESMGAKSISDCNPCPTGYACQAEGLSSYLQNQPGNVVDVVPCPAGYYCQQGTNSEVTSSDNTFSPKPCEAGYKCPADKSVRIRCPPGTYQDDTG